MRTNLLLIVGIFLLVALSFLSKLLGACAMAGISDVSFTSRPTTDAP